ncbi:LPS export ABC transporter periplasmic protein LptC [Legionella spiritensis]|uniref:Lipopolysaccharide export system protein LptC n=1 Tax=Legionella spiritensis TaxID=452 RepID=A0A0W0ZBL5_LEGSP|nr:LPS export ABC transporter periplasmic protein LptC [Legionella spiritensis]KTD66182.1 lipopolysaccharide export system protein LptC [Legionella spiritensis]SNV35095.1 Uncharacterized protein YrbK clustered with lipopolysaccharide transporters [Legionella spiritensis]
MNAAKQAVWLFFTLIALACSGYYFASSSPVEKLDDKTLSQTADTIITHLNVRQFDEQGKLINYLKTPELQHVPENDTHLLQSPEIVIAQPDQPDWEIRSRRAKAVHGGKEITFINDVTVHQQSGEKTQESTLRTNELTYYPQQKLATSALTVTYERPGSIIYSDGMKAWLADKHVKLLSRARATYEPNHG